MPQTVAIQRGTTVVSNETFVTLFTQSGGNATRVITNMLVWYFNTDSPNTYVSLYQTSAGGGASVLGYYYATNDRGGQASPDPNFNANTNGTSSILPVRGAFNTGTQNYMGLILPTSLNGLGTPAYSRSTFVPQNFWIGPSDSVRFAVYGQGVSTINVAWSFTTITES